MEKCIGWALTVTDPRTDNSETLEFDTREEAVLVRDQKDDEGYDTFLRSMWPIPGREA